MPEIDFSSKSSVMTAWHRGRLGNRPQAWDSVADWLGSGYTGNVVIRSRIRNSPHCRYAVPFEEVLATVEELRADGARIADLHVNESMPDSDLAIQGEVSRTVDGLYLHYSTARLPMRVALKDHGREAHRSAAVAILESTLDPSSHDDLRELLDMFDAQGRFDGVVEFSTYSRPVGLIPNRNTVFWETRCY